MPRSFSYELPMTESPTRAQAQVREAVTNQMRESAGMGPAGEASSSLTFQPSWGWPFIAALTRRARGENVSLKFRATELGTADYGTIVAVSGKVAGDDKVASREFWTDMLTADQPARAGDTQ